MLFISKSIAFTAEVTFDSSEVEELCLDIEGIQKVDNNDKQDIGLEESEVSADTSLSSMRAKNTTAIQGIASCANIKDGHREHYYEVCFAEHDFEWGTTPYHANEYEYGKSIVGVQDSSSLWISLNFHNVNE